MKIKAILRSCAFCVAIAIGLQASAEVVAYWPFGEYGLEDASGNGHVLIANGVSIDGNPHECASMSGSQTCFQTTGGVDLSGDPNSAVTIEYWLRYPFAAGYYFAFEYSPNLNDYLNGFCAIFNDDGPRWTGYLKNPNGLMASSCTAENYPSDGLWHHYALEIDPTKDDEHRLTFYIDGVAYNNPVTKSNILADNQIDWSQTVYDFYLGSRNNSVFPIIGDIDDFRVSTGLLDPSEFVKRTGPDDAIMICPADGHNADLHTDNHYLFGSNFTYSCWMKGNGASDPGGMGVLMAQGAWGSAGGAAIKFNVNDRSLWANVTDAAHWDYGTVATSWTGDDLGIFDGEWHQVAMTQVDDQEDKRLVSILLYVDGVLVASNAWRPADFEAVDGAVATLCIGGYANADYSFVGHMADVGIWNRALSADEILGLYNHRINPEDEGLLGYWPLADSLDDEVANGAEAHDAIRYSGSWASSQFLDNGYFRLPTYADWAAGQGDVPAPTVTLSSLSNAGATNVVANFKVPDFGGDNESVELYSVVTLAGYDQPVTNLLCTVTEKTAQNVSVAGLLPSRDYNIKLLAVNGQGGAAASFVKSATTADSGDIFTAQAGCPYVTGIAVGGVNPTGATVSGALDASGVADDVTVRLVFADDTVAAASVASGLWSVTLDSLVPGRNYTYDVVATASNGKVDRVHGVPFFTRGPASFAAELTGRADGTNLTFTVTVEELGLGTTTFTLLAGATADTMAPVDGAVAVYALGDTVESFTLGCAVPWNRTYFWAVKSVSVDGSGRYEAATATRSFDTNDSAVYTWDASVAEGDWENPANWIADRTPNAGYPNSATAYAVIRSENVVKVHISGPKTFLAGGAAEVLSGQVELIGDPARNDNNLSVRYGGSLAANSVLVVDNVTLEWWDYAPSGNNTKIVFRGARPQIDYNATTAIASGDFNEEFCIPETGYMLVPHWGQSVIGWSLFYGEANGHTVNISVSPDSPIFDVFGRRMRVQLVAATITEDMARCVVCTAPNKGECSFEVLDNGIWFNCYRKAGFTIVVK